MEMDNRQERLKETASQVTEYDKRAENPYTAHSRVAQYYGSAAYCMRLCGRKPTLGAS